MFIVSRVRRPVTRHHVCVKNVRCAAGACYPISGFSSRLARRQFPCVVRPPSRRGAVRRVRWSAGREIATRGVRRPRNVYTPATAKKEKEKRSYAILPHAGGATPTCMWTVSTPHARVTRRVPVDHTRTRAPSATGEAQRRTIVELKTHAQLTRR